MENYSTCEISDALIKLGVHHGGYLPDINCVSPGSDSSIRIEGPAYTVKMVSWSDTTSPKPDAHFVDATKEGHIIVIEAPLNVKSAVWGGLMSLGAQARGALGVVISGRCRDIAEHREAGFPVFAKGQSTLGQKQFTRPSELDTPIVIRSSSEGEWPDVQVTPGDWIVADQDGVVAIPVELMERVKQVVRFSRVADDQCKVDIKAGKGVAESFKKYRGA